LHILEIVFISKQVSETFMKGRNHFTVNESYALGLPRRVSRANVNKCMQMYALTINQGVWDERSLLFLPNTFLCDVPHIVLFHVNGRLSYMC